MGHNIILTDLTIIMQRHNNNNRGFLWGTIITIWGLYRYKNNNKGATLRRIWDYTSKIGI